MTTLKDLGILAMGTRLRVLSEAMMATVKDFYSQYDLDFEPRWFPVFQLVQRQPGIGIAAVAAQIGVSHTAINALTKPLLENGLITLVQNPDDARAKQLTLTPAGEVLFTRLQPAWFALEKALLEVFPNGQAATILDTLAALEDAVADVAVPRGLRQVLAPKTVQGGLSLLAYEPENPEHKRYFAALNIEWLQAYFSVEPVDQAMFDDPKATILDKGGQIVMAKVDAQIVGTGALIRRSDDIYELAKMAVSKPFQGKGIGAAIVDHLEDAARGLGLKKLYLVSSIKLPHAVPMYRKLGWTDSASGLHNHYQRSDTSLEKVL